MLGLPFGLLNTPPGLTISYVGAPNFVDVSAGASQSIMEVHSDATVDEEGPNSPVPDTATWAQNLPPGFDAADYDFRMDKVSGVTPQSTGTDIIDAWIAGVTGPAIVAQWGLEFGVGGGTFSGTFRVRPSGGGADLITQSIFINAQVSGP